MPTLNWIGKEAVVKHHKDVPYRLLEPVPELSCGEHGSSNLIVQGDNLHALKALLPRYAGQVKCIYIDPPYNTGKDERDEAGGRRGWIYNDNVNSPEITAWLGQVVGAEAEDLCRHDNNAGIAVGGPTPHLPVAEFRKQMDVNIVGPMIVTQALLLPGLVRGA